MSASEYVRSLRSRVGRALLLLPAVTAVIRDGDQFLVARQRDTRRWSLIGGGIEPGEEPSDAVAREVHEELGVVPTVHRIIGAYGGPELESTYPNGDRVAYATVAYECTIPAEPLTLENAEILETMWVSSDALTSLDHHEWIDRIVRDATSALSGPDGVTQDGRSAGGSGPVRTVR